MSIEADTEIAAPTLVGSQHAASQTWLNKTANGSMRNEPPELRVQSKIAPNASRSGALGDVLPRAPSPLTSIQARFARALRDRR